MTGPTGATSVRPDGTPWGPVRDAIRWKYAEVARSAAGKFLYPTGRAGAEALGYDSDIISSAPPRLLESFCGVGNPFSLGKISTGDAVLDFGCGAGFDLFAASRLCGKEGGVVGVDLTEEMVDKARTNLLSAAVHNFEIVQIDSESIPFMDGSFDVVISNGVINLTPHKLTTFREFFRVLRPGRRLQFADVVLERDLPEGLNKSPEAWSQ